MVGWVGWCCDYDNVIDSSEYKEIWPYEDA